MPHCHLLNKYVKLTSWPSSLIICDHVDPFKEILLELLDVGALWKPSRDASDDHIVVSVGAPILQCVGGGWHCEAVSEGAVGVYAIGARVLRCLGSVLGSWAVAVSGCPSSWNCAGARDKDRGFLEKR